MMGKGIRRDAACLALLAALSACEEAEQVADRFRDMTPYEVYQASLADAGLAETALGRDWLAAGRQALAAPTEVALPFQEEGFISPDEPSAAAYRIRVDRGQRLSVDVGLETPDSTRVFVELFRAAEDANDPARPIVSTDSVPGRFEHAPWRGGEFILRVQPELLRGGRYTVELRVDSRLSFPVEGRTTTAILSVFGAERDAGAREHHGVDIFSSRGTPVLAAIDGRTYRVRTTPIGGNVVWLRGRDEDAGVRLYYAHLDSQAVTSGQDVRVGDTLGFVGNTGNARTTPPHLHFGVYLRREGPVDPYPWLDPPRGTLQALTADVDRLGTWVRLMNEGIRLRTAPSTRAEVLEELERYTPLRVMGSSGSWYRVRLPDGSQGYVAARLTEPTDRPVAQVALRDEPVLSEPDQRAPIMEVLPDGVEVPVLGRFNGYLLVRSPTGREGWVGADGL